MNRDGLVAADRILVVDDSSDIRGLWLMWLTLTGFIVDEADNGAEALVRARDHRPDLVLMDLSMPVMDGIEAIRRLRADSSTRDVPIIALSALGTDESVRQAHEAGADAYVRKPVLPEDLLVHMQHAFKRSRGSVSRRKRPSK